MIKHNKWHRATAASFRNIAKDLRAEAKAMRAKAKEPNTDKVYYQVISQALVAMARANDKEAVRLRAILR